MASLTTVYLISIILSSIAGIGSAFVGNKIYPLSGGADIVEVKPEVVPEVVHEVVHEVVPEVVHEVKPEVVPEVVTPVAQIENVPTNSLEETIKTEFQMDDEFAKNVVAFIKTPVTLWNDIASTPGELKKKFMRALTHPNLNKCPAKLINICKIVNIKYSNMMDLINKKDYTPYGDQTADAISVLSGNWKV